MVLGSCSWADKTMLGTYYPHDVRSAEARLRYYARRFDTVEVDSTFYGLPRSDWVERWVERTPPGFVFHVKAYGLMTQHAVDPRSLHPELRGYRFEHTRSGRVTRPEPKMLRATFDIFLRETRPLRDAGKMGGVLLQFPPYFAATDPERTSENLAYIELASDMLGGLPVLVEFRHPSWVAEDRAADTFAFLAERGLTYVCVDAPQFAERLTMPGTCGATAPIGYVRLHGRNTETYFKRTGSAAERFDYLYSPDELAEWADPIRALADATEVTYVMFNNCRSDYAPRNARQMAEILGDIVEEREGGAPTGEATPEDGAGEGPGGGEQLGLDV